MRYSDKLGNMEQPKRAARECLLLCASGQPGGDAALTSLLHHGVDWAYFLDQGLQHHLLPLAYHGLRRLDEDLVPPEVMAKLRARYYTNLARNLRLRASLDEAITTLHQAGIEPIILKGGALAGTVYADPGLRPMGDLDLLIPPEAMEQVGPVLASIGYRLSGRLTAQLVTFQARIGGRLEWLREQYGHYTCLDVQHELVGTDLLRHAFDIDSHALWAAARPLDVGGAHALQLSAEDTLIHLCLHSAVGHGYAVRLIGTVDLDWLVAGETSEDFWRRLVDRAEQFRVRTIVYRGLCLARDLLGTPVPASTMKALAPGALRKGLLERLAPLDEEHVWKGVGSRPNGVRELLLYATLMERPRDVLGMVRAILFPEKEWLAARYGLEGNRQARLYRLAHPFRVARALLRALQGTLEQSSLE